MNKQRLTKQYPNGNITLDVLAFSGELQETLDREVSAAIEPIKAAVKRLAEYEDAEERGTLISLPCNVGDTMYEPYDDDIEESKVTNICIEASGKIIEADGGIFDTNDIGKTIFFTREEAEQALKGGKANEI